MSFWAEVCEACRYQHRMRNQIFACVGCGAECCENCFDRYAHCKACGRGKSDAELVEAANADGWCFELPHESYTAAGSQ